MSEKVKKSCDIHSRPVQDQPKNAFRFELFLCPCVPDHILNVFEHDILQTACGNFSKFTTLKCSWRQR